MVSLPSPLLEMSHALDTWRIFVTVSTHGGCTCACAHREYCDATRENHVASVLHPPELYYLGCFGDGDGNASLDGSPRRP